MTSYSSSKLLTCILSLLVGTVKSEVKDSTCHHSRLGRISAPYIGAAAHKRHESKVRYTSWLILLLRFPEPDNQLLDSTSSWILPGPTPVDVLLECMGMWTGIPRNMKSVLNINIAGFVKRGHIVL